METVKHKNVYIVQWENENGIQQQETDNDQVALTMYDMLKKGYKNTKLLKVIKG
ncbi:hypothetical protein QTG56_25675 (plasmid) [Rossellomorea sp. AcN35-11]|nr:hypothetical protein [Rossellomorea aquimaris]WJV32006.1 hypothetical protein QTG56_25675 [Rossellomorea sp. AcN35-11]